MERKPLIAGNWKMFKTAAEAVRLVQDLSYLIEEVQDVEIVVCPPFTALKSVSTLIEYDKPRIMLGAQNMFWEEEGAYTGEVSPLMLKELNVSHVVIGHSERRQHFGEDDEAVNRKVRTALKHGLFPIMCIGETLEEREKGETNTIVRLQVLAGLADVDKKDADKIIIAYEPIWAIGTGKTATPQEANDVIRHIRATVGSTFTPELARKVRILYGGSVKPENIAELMIEPDIDGALVGGASLDAHTFAEIVKFR